MPAPQERAERRRARTAPRAPCLPRGRRACVALIRRDCERRGEISSALEQTRDMIGAKQRVPVSAAARLRGAAPEGWFASRRRALGAPCARTASSPLYVLSAT